MAAVADGCPPAGPGELLNVVSDQLHFAGTWLCNMSQAGARECRINGVEWPSVEHFFQAHKHTGPAGGARVQQIRACESPFLAKKLSYQPGSSFIAQQWEGVKLAVMYAGVRGKFTDPRNSDMLQWLLNTRGLYIVEHCRDAVWGDGVESSQEQQSGPGSNWLGLCLTWLRIELSRELELPLLGDGELLERYQAEFDAFRATLEEHTRRLEEAEQIVITNL